MKFTAQQIATLVSGKIEGNEKVSVHAIGKIEEGKPGEICFLANPKYEDHLYLTQASIVLVNETLSLKQPVNTTLIRVKDAYAAFALLLKTYAEIVAPQPKTGIEQPVFMGSDSTMEEDVYVGAFSYIGEKTNIGSKTQIYPNCRQSCQNNLVIVATKMP